MLNCNYIIHIPGGGKITIPAFAQIGVDDTKFADYFSEWVDALKIDDTGELRDTGKSNTIFNKMYNHIVDVTRSYNLSKGDIKNALLVDGEYIDKLNALNNYIVPNSSYNDFRRSLQNYLKKNPDQFETILKQVSNKVTPATFRNVPVGKILGQTSLKIEQKRLQTLVNSSRAEGFDTHYLRNIDLFIDLLVSNKWLDLDKETIFSFSSEFGVYSANIDEYSFFKSGSMDSLFMALFKKIAINQLDVESLNSVLKASGLKSDYKEVRDFFKNDFEDVINLSVFEKLLESKANNKIINNIINLLGDKISSKDKNSFLAYTKYILQHLNPDAYGYNAIQELRAVQALQDRERVYNTNYQKNIDIKVAESLGAFRDFKLENDPKEKKKAGNTRFRDMHYGESLRITNLSYDYMSHNVTEGQDLLLVPFGKGDKTYYNEMLIQHMYPRPDGTFIQAVYKDINGHEKIWKKIYRDEVFIRKRENAKIPYNANHIGVKTADTVNLVVDYKTFTRNDSQEIIKEYASIGDETNLGIVVGVYPAYLIVKKEDGDTYKQKYSEVKWIKSGTLHTIGVKTDLTFSNFNYNAFSTVDDVSMVSKGDFVVDPGSTSKNDIYVPIIHTNSENLFVMVGKGGKRKVKVIPRSAVTEYQMKNKDRSKILMHTYAELTNEELQKLHNNVNILSSSSLSKATMSTFTNPQRAKTGDYFKAFINNTQVWGKVLDVNTGKAIYFTPGATEYTPINIQSLSDIEFYTDRDIKSPYSLSTIRMNNWKIQHMNVTEAENNPKLKEVRYVVPNHVQESDIEILPDGYATIGRYQDLDTKIPEGYKDITPYMIRTVFSEQPNTKLYAEVQFGSNRYFRNTVGTQLIAGFNEIDPEIKHSMKALQPGMYFSIVTNGKLGNELYRVENVNGDQVTAQHNKINADGKVITVERIFDINDLYKSKENGKTPDNSIFSLYVQHGNTKFDVLINAASQDLSSEEVGSAAALNEFVQTMKIVFTPHDIGVEIDFKGEGFKDGQNAKIVSSVVNNELETKIVLNGKTGTKNDLIHENLHILFAILRHEDSTAYGQTIDAILGNKAVEDTVGVREEKAIRKIVDSLNRDLEMDFLFSPFHNVMEDLYKVTQLIYEKHPSKTKKEVGSLIDITTLVTNPTDFFKLKISDILGIKDDISSPYYNARLIDSETAFINWMDNNNVILKCD